MKSRPVCRIDQSLYPDEERIPVIWHYNGEFVIVFSPPDKWQSIRSSSRPTLWGGNHPYLSEQTIRAISIQEIYQLDKAGKLDWTSVGYDEDSGMHHGQNGLMGSKIYNHRTGINGRKTIRAWADLQQDIKVKRLVDGWIGQIDYSEVGKADNRTFKAKIAFFAVLTSVIILVIVGMIVIMGMRLGFDVVAEKIFDIDVPVEYKANDDTIDIEEIVIDDKNEGFVLEESNDNTEGDIWKNHIRYHGVVTSFDVNSITIEPVIVNSDPYLDSGEFLLTDQTECYDMNGERMRFQDYLKTLSPNTNVYYDVYMGDETLLIIQDR